MLNWLLWLSLRWIEIWRALRNHDDTVVGRSQETDIDDRLSAQFAPVMQLPVVRELIKD
jgi:hypothetical protein